MIKFIVGVIIIVCGFNFFSENKLSPQDCVKNEQFNQIKQITEVRQFRYNYCIFKKAGCSGNYVVPKRWFENNHTKITCPKEVK